MTRNLVFQESPWLLSSLLAGYILVAILAIFGCRMLSVLVLVTVTVFIGLVFHFYRFPSIHVEHNTEFASPASGVIMGYDEKSRTVVLRLSLLDLHFQVAPRDGVCKKIEYKRGTFHMSHFLEKSKFNEHQIFHFEDSRGKPFWVKQIAGQLTRRLVAWIKPGERVRKGQAVGMIKLGSRVDTQLPEDYRFVREVGEQIEVGDVLAVYNNGSGGGGVMNSSFPKLNR